MAKKKSNYEELPTKICPNCNELCMEEAPECQNCGHVFQTEYVETHSVGELIGLINYAIHSGKLKEKNRYQVVKVLWEELLLHLSRILAPDVPAPTPEDVKPSGEEQINFDEYIK